MCQQGYETCARLGPRKDHFSGALKTIYRVLLHQMSKEKSGRSACRIGGKNFMVHLLHIHHWVTT